MDFYRFNSADEDKQLAAEKRDGLYYLRLDAESAPLTTRLHQVDSYTAYVGKAVSGTLTSQALWQIRKIVTDAGGNMTVTFADNVTEFTKVWDDRATYGY